MKRNLLISILIIFVSQASAQKIEVSAYASAGFFHYIGNYSTANIYIGPSISSSLTYIDKRDNNPYGSKSILGNSFGVQGQFISKQRIIGGLQLGIENLKSEVHVDELKGQYPEVFPFDATSILSKQFFNINPYLGYRFLLGKVKIDLMPGIDIGISMSSYMKVRTDYFYLNNRVKDIASDYRLRFGSAIYYNRLGITASYSRGFKNYVSIIKGSETAGIRSELFRLGFIYRFY